MNQYLQRIHDIGLRAWLLFLQWANGLIGFALVGIAGLAAVRPNLVVELTTTLTPMQQTIAGILWCALVHYALRRAKKAGE
jgi:hypothetical protein